MQIEIQSNIDRLDSKLKLLEKSSQENAEILSLSNQYLCVAIVGRLEQDLKIIFQEYCSRGTKRKFNRAVERLCWSFQNPTFDKIIDLVSLFDEDYSKELSLKWSSGDVSLKSILNRMVDERKTIAHQKNKNANVTIIKNREYFATYKTVVFDVYGNFTG